MKTYSIILTFFKGNKFDKEVLYDNMTLADALNLADTISCNCANGKITVDRNNLYINITVRS